MEDHSHWAISRELPVRPWHLAPKEKDQSLGKLFPVIALRLINNVFLPQQPELCLRFIYFYFYFFDSLPLKTKTEAISHQLDFYQNNDL